MRYFFVFCLICSVSLKANLKPYWHSKVLESYQNGIPKRSIFYEQGSDGQEIYVKELTYFSNSNVSSECNLGYVDENDLGYKQWKSKVVPNGLCVSFFQNGQAKELLNYKKGLLNGEVKYFYENGFRNFVIISLKNKREIEGISEIKALKNINLKIIWANVLVPKKLKKFNIEVYIKIVAIEKY